MIKKRMSSKRMPIMNIILRRKTATLTNRNRIKNQTLCNQVDRQSSHLQYVPIESNRSCSIKTNKNVCLNLF